MIEVAGRLFSEKGYESVSVRDILQEVNGAPGMFYYYFKSKQDIYLAVMETFISVKLERKCALLEDTEMPFEERRKILVELIAEDIHGYASRFVTREGETVSDTSYKIYDLIRMISRLIKPYAAFMLQGIREGKIANKFSVTEENAIETSTFILYGIWGLIYNDRFTDVKVETGLQNMESVIQRLFY